MVTLCFFFFALSLSLIFFFFFVVVVKKGLFERGVFLSLYDYTVGKDLKATHISRESLSLVEIDARDRWPKLKWDVLVSGEKFTATAGPTWPHTQPPPQWTLCLVSRIYYNKKKQKTKASYMFLFFLSNVYIMLKKKIIIIIIISCYYIPLTRQVPQHTHTHTYCVFNGIISRADEDLKRPSLPF